MSYISILNHSSSSVCQNGQRRMCTESFEEGLSTILTFSGVWLRVCGRASVRELKRDCVGVCARRFVQRVLKFCEWLRGYGKHTIKHPVPEWNARGHYMHKDVCIKCVWGGRTVHTVWLCACLCLNMRVWVTASVHNISHTILLQYFYTSGRTVSCIIVSLNLETNPMFILLYCSS